MSKRSRTKPSTVKRPTRDRDRVVYRWEHPKDGKGPFHSNHGVRVGYDIKPLSEMYTAWNDIGSENYIEHEDWRCGISAKQFHRLIPKMRSKGYHKWLQREGYRLVRMKVPTNAMRFGKQQVTFNSKKVKEKEIVG